MARKSYSKFDILMSEKEYNTKVSPKDVGHIWFKHLEMDFRDFLDFICKGHSFAHNFLLPTKEERDSYIKELIAKHYWGKAPKKPFFISKNPTNKRWICTEQENRFLSARFVVYDFDDFPLTFQETINRLSNFPPNIGHLSYNNGVKGKGNRFRLMYFFREKIEDKGLYTMMYVAIRRLIFEELGLSEDLMQDNRNQYAHQLFHGNARLENPLSRANGTFTNETFYSLSEFEKYLDYRRKIIYGCVPTKNESLSHSSSSVQFYQRAVPKGHFPNSLISKVILPTRDYWSEGSSIYSRNYWQKAAMPTHTHDTHTGILRMSPQNSPSSEETIQALFNEKPLTIQFPELATTISSEGTCLLKPTREQTLFALFCSQNGLVVKSPDIEKDTTVPLWSFWVDKRIHGTEVTEEDMEKLFYTVQNWEFMYEAFNMRRLQDLIAKYDNFYPNVIRTEVLGPDDVKMLTIPDDYIELRRKRSCFRNGQRRRKTLYRNGIIRRIATRDNISFDCLFFRLIWEFQKYMRNTEQNGRKCDADNIIRTGEIFHVALEVAFANIAIMKERLAEDMKQCRPKTGMVVNPAYCKKHGVSAKSVKNVLLVKTCGIENMIDIIKDMSNEDAVATINKSFEAQERSPISKRTYQRWKSKNKHLFE